MILGLPARGTLLVNKVNAENIIWQEIINAGNVGLAFEFYNSGPSNSLNSETNFLKLLVDASRKQILPHEQFVIRFAEKKIQDLRETESSVFWNVILVLAKTRRWRDVAERVLNIQCDDHTKATGEAHKTVRSGFNDFGNYSADSPTHKVSV